MTDNRISLFCLVNGEATSNAFSIKIPSTDTVDDLKKLIKADQTPIFDDITANSLTLWRVSLPVISANKHKPIVLSEFESATELDPTDDISDVFEDQPPKKTIHIIIQRPPPVHAPVPARVSTPLSGYLSDNSRPGTPLSGDLHADIKRITEKFFTPGSDNANFLNAFVKGEVALPVTTGPIRGLPRAWRRGFGVGPENRPSLLFMDLPDPSTPDSASRNLAAGSILKLVKENNRYHIPVFGVSGCGKTRAVIELLSQHWGFYFNAADDDWGSGDMMTLYGSVRDHLKDLQASYTVMDLEANNAYARKITLLLFLSRLLIFKYCISVPGSSETFNSARWALLQVCPHVLFKDMFNALFLKLLDLQHHGLNPLSLLVRNVYDDAKDRLVERGCLPKIKDNTRLLVINDEAQFLGDQFNGSFQSMSSSDESPRPILSPILHAFRDIGQHQLTLVTCGTGLSINTLFWVQSSGSGLKDSSTTFEDDQSKLALDEHLPQDAVKMLFQKFVGRYRPAIAAVERIVEGNDPGAWKKTIEDAEDRLVSWAHRYIKGNLCYEISRLHDKHNKYKDQLVESIDSMLGLLMYQRCMFGNHDLVLKEVDPQLVEHAFGRIKIIKGRAVTIMDEPFVSKAVENYFAAVDPYFAREVRKRMVKSTPIEQGCVFEWFMMKVFSETFNERPLSNWPHQPPISNMCPALVGKVEIVGWREPGLVQGTTHGMMSMEEFMDAHVNHQSTRNNLPVAPFFFPKTKPSGPDLVFFIRIDGARLVPVFVQMKLHQGSSNFSERDWNDALSTVSAPKIEGHARTFRKYCPNNVYISMIIAYPTKWTDKLPAPSELPKDPSGVQQVVINISDDNFGDIFPQEHVEFIDRLKNARKRSADDDDSNDEDCSKKQRS
ncbi:hypothetical protein BG006_011376 [Podila minutissima]|uniref:Crinkler effector protein N-terminal domain-containing protein n=1 Tax=Podila minutissima TaxID=64525 RepID=A0A9P5VI57_9FUNG|nr:hypothetical protein BG006_011376 [Podila minutissima]